MHYFKEFKFYFDGKSPYKIENISGGVNERGGYSFIFVVKEREVDKPINERMKICVWGHDFTDQLKVGDKIMINGLSSAAVSRAQPEGSDKVYSTLAITCAPHNILKCEDSPEKAAEVEPEPPTDLGLPF